MKRSEIGLLLVITAAILGAIIIIAVNERNSSIAQVLLTLALVLITFTYAWHTRKMAEAMKKQRHDMFRPIIDIVRENSSPTDLAKQAYDLKEGKLPVAVSCTLKNIGVGPAVDLHYYVSKPDLKRQHVNFGTLAKETNITHVNLATLNIKSNTMLAVFYYDIFGNLLVSSRIISIFENHYKIGELSIEPVIWNEEDILP